MQAEAFPTFFPSDHFVCKSKSSISQSDLFLNMSFFPTQFLLAVVLLSFDLFLRFLFGLLGPLFGISLHTEKWDS